MRLASLVVALLAFSPALVVAQDRPSANEIVDRALDTNTIGFQSGQVSMTLTITDQAGEVRERAMTIRGREDDGRSSAVVRVTAPAAQAGQTYLFRENPTGEDDVFVYLPALDDAPRRISGSQKNGAFMGSHFTYNDLESRDIREADYTEAPDEVVGGFPVYVIDAAPHDLEDLDYARARLWIRQSDYIPLRVRFFAADGTEVKTIFTEETDVASSGRVYVRQLTLRPAAGGSTTMRIANADFDVVVDPTELTPQAMAQ
jgi:hypothetical protein